VSSNLSPPSGKGIDNTGGSPNRLHQLVHDNSLDVACNVGKTPTRDTSHTRSLPSGLHQLARDDGPGATQSDISASRLHQLNRENYPGSLHFYEPSRPYPNGLQQPACENSPVILRGRGRRYDNQFDGSTYHSELPCEVMPDEQHHNNDANTSRVSTDPYQAQRSQSPIRRQPRSPGSGFDTTNSQRRDATELTRCQTTMWDVKFILGVITPLSSNSHLRHQNAGPETLSVTMMERAWTSRGC
jgi:hypothetical protein